MNDSDSRNLSRDSLFILAEVRVGGREAEHRVKVRNLSAGGMMGEGPVKVARGDPIEINLKNVGWVSGSIAWVQDNRFGVAFAEEIDPRVIRVQLSPPLAPEAQVLKRQHTRRPAPLGPKRKII